jgi:2'-5' RNA ligase
MALRIFLAIDIDEEVQKSLSKVKPRLDEVSMKLRWTEKDNRHVTLHFLGDVPDGEVMDLCRMVTEGAGELSPFEIGVRGLQVMPAGGPPRVISASIQDESGALNAMYELYAERLSESGFRVDGRRYRPHVTLARIKSISDGRPLREAVGRYAETDFGQQAVDELVVYSSQLTPEGPIYVPVTSAKLG